MTDDEIRFEVSVEVAEGRVAVVARAGATESRATIERSAEADIQSYIPIGTRDAAQLTMRLEDAPIALTPGPGRYRRGSYKVEARHAGCHYLLEPASEVSSRLSRDGVALCEFTRTGDGVIRVWWERGPMVGPVDAALGYALVAAFGAGAKSLLGAFFDPPDTGPPIAFV
jgi:hypothetical protein